jgi:hypothetical protein
VPAIHAQASPSFARQGNSAKEAIWSGKRVSNSRPQPWQGCALPTELFPRLTSDVVKEKPISKMGISYLVAWGEITALETPGISCNLRKSYGN